MPVSVVTRFGLYASGFEQTAPNFPYLPVRGDIENKLVIFKAEEIYLSFRDNRIKDFTVNQELHTVVRPNGANANRHVTVVEIIMSILLYGKTI